MSDTRVVNRRKEREEVYIGRGSPFGNPYRIGPSGPSSGARGVVIAMYREWFEGKVYDDPEFRAQVEALRGKVLGCYCKPQPCHGDVIVEWLALHMVPAPMPEGDE